MGVVVKLEPLPGELIVAPCFGGTVEIVPSKPIEPVPAGGSVIAAEAKADGANNTPPTTIAATTKACSANFID